MIDIHKNYIVDENNRKVAVQLALDEFEKIEEILENYGLVQLMKEDEGGKVLAVKEAKAYYQTLNKVEILTANSLTEIGKVEKMTGYPS